MIDDSTTVFPNNVVSLLAVRFQQIDADLTILKRPLRSSDPAQSLGIWGALWEPEEDSYEIGHQSPGEPTFSRYHIGVQGFIKHGDEQAGLATHSVLSSLIRRVVYRDEPLRVALPQLVVSDGTFTERLMRWGVRTQRYMNNDIQGKFVYLSTLDLWVETEMSA